MPEKLSLPDVLTLLVLAAFFGFLTLGALRLRRIKKRGLDGHAHRLETVGRWTLRWPDWWPRPVRQAERWWAGPLDHDGRMEIRTLTSGDAPVSADKRFRTWLEERHARLDAWDVEELDGRHGTIRILEGRADWEMTERAYLWLACVPGRSAGDQLLLCYRSSVLYGLADGFWLGEVAAGAAHDDPSSS